MEESAGKKKKTKWIQIVVATLALTLVLIVLGIGVLHIARDTPQEQLAQRHTEKKSDDAFPLRAIVVAPLALSNCFAAKHNFVPLQFGKQDNSKPWCIALNWDATTTIECSKRDGGCDKQINLCSSNINGVEPIYVLMLHGIKCSGEVWLAIVRHWMQTQQTNKQFVFICPDLLGHGKSSWPKEEKYTVELHIAALERLLSSLLDKSKKPSIHIVGHSLGAMLALELTALLLKTQWLHISSLTLMATPYFESRDQANESANAHSFWFRNQWLATTCCGYLVCRQNWLWQHALKNKFAKQFPQLPNAALVNGLQHNHHGIKSSIESVVLDHRAKPAIETVCSAKIPTLLIDSDADRLCTESQKQLRQIFQQLAPKHHHSVVLKGAKHGFIVHDYVETTTHLKPFIETIAKYESR